MTQYTQYQSWGGVPKHSPAEVRRQVWRQKPLPLEPDDPPLLPFGLGRSYGDSCQNSGGIILDITGLDRFISFDPAEGIIRCEAGVTLEQILELVVPHGWFLPVIPGTKYVTVGGAIANDIHGKNHHRSGTFGCHVSRFELLRSDGKRLLCHEKNNTRLYRATIGGLGLTGLITWAEIRLRRIANPFITMETIKFKNLDEFMELTRRSDREFEYTVAWIDCAASGRHVGRGLFMRGNHASPRFGKMKWARKPPWLAVPFNAPGFAINKWSIKAFNSLYFRKQFSREKKDTVPYEPFFFPLDSVRDWNRIYGGRGFFQYQCVVPTEAIDTIAGILSSVSDAGQGSFLSVLKQFGTVESPGMLSFPRPGLTLAIDIPNNGEATRKLMDELDEKVFAADGALYPAKDARMAPERMQLSFEQLEAFEEHLDPRFMSDFWRRMTEGA